MAISNGVTNMLLHEVHIESVQTITPHKITDPRPILSVSAADPTGLGIFQNCLHILLYYTKASQEESGWLHAGWIKESLSRALLEQPLFAGRFRVNDSGEMEIIGNDSGVRLVESRSPMTMAEFLSYKDSREDTEEELVFWKTIDEQSPQYSPLFYVQVTYFQCGGSSVGISCSVVLADLMFKENFLKKWADIHHNLLSDKRLPVTPFYNSINVGKNGKSANHIFVSIPSKKCGKTMIFSVAAENVDLDDDDALKICVEEAESKFGFGKLFVNINSSSCSAIRIKNFRKEGLDKSKIKGIAEVGWDVFGAKEVAFREGNKPAGVSYWFGFISGGLVLAVPSSADGEGAYSVIVTVSN
ncbi:deacetylvindoline O-acetyltransferase [Argentina anserina]|uniref:deacetylvindoline O-acetyltransferase n=1 Tax=Argentina anserina TaxID=57926 RepID=UPI0021765EDB|nr:deacetylvindoline O-acetyltransferase [Potentilla anserina]